MAALPPDEVSEDMFQTARKAPALAALRPGRMLGSVAGGGAGASSRAPGGTGFVGGASAKGNAFTAAFAKPPPKDSASKPSAPAAPTASSMESDLMAKLGFATFGRRQLLDAGGHVVRRATGEEMTVEERHSRFRTSMEVDPDAGGGVPGGGGDDDSDDDDDDDDGPAAAAAASSSSSAADPSVDPNGLKLPVTHSVELRGHPKPLGAIALDRTGSRLITGGWDHMLRFWNFAGMTSSLRFYHELDPMGEFHGAYTFNQIRFTADGDRFVLCRAHPQPILYSKEGKELFEFAKGDLYVAEMRYTKGHTAEVTGCQFSPNDPNVLVTGAKDSTVRLWDLERVQFRNAEVIKTAHGLARGRKAPVTACAWSADGLSLYAGTTGGAILTWSHKGPFVKPAAIAEGCHAPLTNITSLTAGPQHRLYSRGDDGTVKVWDCRKFGTPLAAHSDLETVYEHCDVLLSPDNRYFVTGTSVQKASGGQARVVFFDALTLRRVAAVPLPAAASAVRLLWHPDLNQVLVGCSDGVCRVYYDPLLSRKGALLCATKQKKAEPTIIDMTHNPADIKTPHALPMFREDSAKAVRRRHREAYVPDQSGLPTALDHDTAAQRPSLKHEMMKQAGISKNSIRSEDPVAALRAVAKGALDQPLYIAPMYAKTQPTPIFAEPEEESHPIHGSVATQAAKKQRRLEELRQSGAMVRITED